MLFVLGIVARIAIGLGAVFALGITVSSVPNRVCRFVVLFAVGLAWSFLLNYSDVRLLARRPTGWALASIAALALAIWGTFWPPYLRKSNTP
jgi:hypothetical protein